MHDKHQKEWIFEFSGGKSVIWVFYIYDKINDKKPMSIYLKGSNFSKSTLSTYSCSGAKQ